MSYFGQSYFFGLNTSQHIKLNIQQNTKSGNSVNRRFEEKKDLERLMKVGSTWGKASCSSSGLTERWSCRLKSAWVRGSSEPRNSDPTCTITCSSISSLFHTFYTTQTCFLLAVTQAKMHLDDDWDLWRLFHSLKTKPRILFPLM